MRLSQKYGIAVTIISVLHDDTYKIKIWLLVINSVWKTHSLFVSTSYERMFSDSCEEY